MSTALLPQDSNPFAPPEVTHITEDDRKIRPGQSYRVVENRFYCRAVTDVSEVCWLSGQSEGTLRTMTLSKNLKPISLGQLLISMAVPVVAATFCANIGICDWSLKSCGLLCVLLTPFVLFLVGVVGRASFKLSVGAGTEACHQQVVSRAATGLTVLLTIFFCVIIPGSSSALIGWQVLLWILGCIVIRAFLRPRRFLADVKRIDDNTYLVTGLTPEFLHGANLLQNQKMHWPER